MWDAEYKAALLLRLRATSTKVPPWQYELWNDKLHKMLVSEEGDLYGGVAQLFHEVNPEFDALILAKTPGNKSSWWESAKYALAPSAKAGLFGGAALFAVLASPWLEGLDPNFENLTAKTKETFDISSQAELNAELEENQKIRESAPGAAAEFGGLLAGSILVGRALRTFVTPMTRESWVPLALILIIIIRRQETTFPREIEQLRILQTEAMRTLPDGPLKLQYANIINDGLQTETSPEPFPLPIPANVHENPLSILHKGTSIFQDPTVLRFPTETERKAAPITIII